MSRQDTAHGRSLHGLVSFMAAHIGDVPIRESMDSEGRIISESTASGTTFENCLVASGEAEHYVCIGEAYLPNEGQ